MMEILYYNPFQNSPLFYNMEDFFRAWLWRVRLATSLFEMCFLGVCRIEPF